MHRKTAVIDERTAAIGSLNTLASHGPRGHGDDARRPLRPQAPGAQAGRAAKQGPTAGATPGIRTSRQAGAAQGECCCPPWHAYGRPESLNTDDYRACPVVLPAAPLRDSALVPSGDYFFRPCGRSSARGGEPGHRSQDGRAPGHARSLRPSSCIGRQRGVDWVEVHRHRAPARAPGKSFREVETVESLQPRQEGAVGCTAGTGW
jgi:hypothetical protein